MGMLGFVTDDFWHALVLALASSTDNFAVGLSLGLGKARHLPLWVNGIISICNAVGALLAGFGGFVLGQEFPSLAPLLASIAFGYLGGMEIYEVIISRSLDQESGHRPSRQVSVDWKATLSMAVPMTLNNLAGGVAGGAAGIAPWVAFFHALFASFCLMEIGFWCGKQVGARMVTSNSVLGMTSGAILLALSSMTLLEYFNQL